MIEIVLLDDKDFINEYKHFKNDEHAQMGEYVGRAILDKNTYIIKIKKWKDK